MKEDLKEVGELAMQICGRSIPDRGNIIKAVREAIVTSAVNRGKRLENGVIKVKVWKADGVGPFRYPKDFGFYSEIGSHWAVLNRGVT